MGEEWKVAAERQDGHSVVAVYHFPCGYKAMILPTSPVLIDDVKTWHLEQCPRDEATGAERDG